MRNRLHATWAWVKRRRIVAIAAVAGVVALVVGLALRPAEVADSRGEPAPTFVTPDLRAPQRTISLAALSGRPVVLNFWASWCVPCRRELPAFRAAHQEWGSRVAFLGMNYKDSRGSGLAMLREFGVTYPSGMDPDGDVGSAYRVIGMPTTLFISGSGRILERHTGELRAGELRAALERLTATAPKESAYRPAFDGLCAAAAQAADGDPVSARATFFDRSHQRLHDLASALEATDRAAAARLLEAKSRVEQDLTAGTPSPADDLRALSRVMAVGIAAVGQPSPGACR